MLTVNQYREIRAYEGGGLFDKMIHIVAVYKNLDSFEVQEWNESKLIREYKAIEPLTDVSNNYQNCITIDDVELSLIDFKTLTLGQWIDIESMVSDNYIENLSGIAASIYLNNTGGGMYSDKWENYGDININYRANKIDQIDVQSVLGACHKYLKFRENLFESYELFDDPLKDVNPDELSEEELIIYNEEKKQRENGAKNQWSKMLNILTNNDVTKFADVLKLNLFLTLNQVTHLKRNNSQ